MVSDLRIWSKEQYNKKQNMKKIVIAYLICSENGVGNVICRSGYCLIQFVVSDFSEVANDLD